MTCAECEHLAQFKTLPSDGQRHYACWARLMEGRPNELKSLEGGCSSWERMKRLPFEETYDDRRDNQGA